MILLIKILNVRKVLDILKQMGLEINFKEYHFSIGQNVIFNVGISLFKDSILHFFLFFIILICLKPNSSPYSSFPIKWNKKN